jgi:uncharacterized protein YjbI with pentapeptide repeats
MNIEHNISGKNWRNWRIFWLVASALAGVVLAALVFWAVGYAGDGQSARARFVVSASLLLLPLPTLFFLWLFRTYDTRDNINSGLLSSCLGILLSDNLQNRCVALALLADMHRRNLFVGQIRFATHRIDMTDKENHANLSDVDLSGMHLQGANFTGGNLSEANLSEADLSGAVLSQADLTFANLRNAKLADAEIKQANLADANLKNANLCGANLEDAQGLQSANMKGAIYNDDTKFPADFNPKACGMKKGEA